VVLDADPRELGDLTAAQPRDTASPTEIGKPGIGWRDARSTAGEELADLAAGLRTDRRYAVTMPPREALPEPLSTRAPTALGSLV
jgi:hypothetical protein